jgi:hypothetical protein
LQPRLVFLVFTYTDEADNTRNVRYNEYFKPYYEVVDRQLVLRGTPVPESIHHFHQRHPWLLESYCARAAVRAYYTWTGPAAISVKSPTTAIVREMNAALASRGCTLALGFESRHADLSALAIEQDIPSVILVNDHVYQTHGRHWTPEGHALVSRKIIEFLDEHGLRDAPGGP